MQDSSIAKKSPIFDLLLGDDGDDVEKLVAYALYKKHKRDWCSQFENEHGRTPNDDEKIAFAKGLSIPSQLDRYLKDAQDALGEYAGYMIDEAEPEIAREAISARIEEAANKIEKSGGFWRAVFQGLAASVITTIALIVLAIGIQFFGIDLIDGINAISAN